MRHILCRCALAAVACVLPPSVLAEEKAPDVAGSWWSVRMLELTRSKDGEGHLRRRRQYTLEGRVEGRT
jgi:hypothetical protein